MLNFKVIKKDAHSNARAGEFETAHGKVLTPTFVPVGTQATIKSLTPKDLEEIRVQFFFGNTYHLHLKPGEDVIQEFGGLAKFMGWRGVTITDSGGFQVFSLGEKRAVSRSGRARAFVAPSLKKFQISNVKYPISNEKKDSGQGTYKMFTFQARMTEGGESLESKMKILQEDEIETLVKITDDGVEFVSHIDGGKHFFSPEESIRIQKKLGADIILSFDECPPFPATHQEAEAANRRTHEWASRGLREFQISNTTNNPISNNEKDSGQGTFMQTERSQAGMTISQFGRFEQGLVGIIQGSTFQDLREESAKFISSLDFDALAIGGVSVGESKEDMRNAISWVVPHLPENKFRHLLGIGEVDDIFDAIELGMDTMDCVIPSRLGRTGFVFVHPPEGKLTNRFRVDLMKSVYLRDKNPVDPHCDCYICRTFTRGYLHHLFRSRELLAYRLATYHNVYFLIDLTRKIREAIFEERFQRLKKIWLNS